MKKTILSVIIFFLLLVMPASGEMGYRLRLTNGGELTTPQYWLESGQIFFFFAGGIVGIEKRQVAGIDRAVMAYERTGETEGDADLNLEKKPVPLPAEKEKSEAKKGNEKVDIKAYKDKKDKLKVELDDTLEKLREATRLNDNEAKEKIKEEMRKTSGQIYKLTDEITEKNQGKLPEGWWDEKTK